MNKEQEITHVFWDWYEVLGLNGFWHLSSKENPEIKEFVDYVFTKPEIINKWMRNDYTTENLLNKSKSTIAYHELIEAFISDINVATVNHTLFSAIKAIYPKAKHSIITDNMSIFEQYYLSKSEFVKENFKYVFCSSSAKLLKSDNPGLYEYSLKSLKWNSFKNCLLLDDSPKNCNRFIDLGGKAILVKKNTQ